MLCPLLVARERHLLRVGRLGPRRLLLRAGLGLAQPREVVDGTADHVHGVQRVAETALLVREARNLHAVLGTPGVLDAAARAGLGDELRHLHRVEGVAQTAAAVNGTVAILQHGLTLPVTPVRAHAVAVWAGVRRRAAVVAPRRGRPLGRSGPQDRGGRGLGQARADHRGPRAGHLGGWGLFGAVGGQFLDLPRWGTLCSILLLN